MALARILVTGVANPYGRRLAARLLEHPDAPEVVGVDTRRCPPELEGAITVLQGDLRDPGLGTQLRAQRLTRIVHNDVVQFAEDGRSPRQLHDSNVIGTLQLLAAAGALPELEAIVLRGSASIYGSEPAAPAFRREEEVTTARAALDDDVRLRTRFQRDLAEIERLFATFARRHAGVACTLLRLQPVVGGEVDTPVNRLIRAPLVPIQLGYDPRLQVLHLDDAVDAMVATVMRGGDVAGEVINVSAPEVVSLSRVLRLVGRPVLPIAPILYTRVVRAGARLGGLPALTADIERYLRYGRAVALERQERSLGWAPRLDTVAALADAAGVEVMAA